MRTILLSALAVALLPTLQPSHAQTSIAQFSLPIPAFAAAASLAAAPAAAPADPAPLPDAPAPAITALPSLTSVPCHTRGPSGSPSADSADNDREPCLQNPYDRFLNTTAPLPLTPGQKALLAVHNLRDPGNIATITANAGFTIATNAHTAYGPGLAGFGRDIGYTFLQDATVEFFGTFLIPSATHQDPHYHRMPGATVPRRILHAFAAVGVAQSDFGAPMPNYSALLTNPICAEISNLYVPGINPNAPSTGARIAIGYATEPADNLLTEFLPDVARRIHIRVLFVQQILNQVSSANLGAPASVSLQ